MLAARLGAAAAANGETKSGYSLQAAPL